MTDVRSSLERARSSFPTPDLPLERVLARHDQIQRNRRIRAGVVAGAIVLVGMAMLVRTVVLERDDVPAAPVGNGAIVVRDAVGLLMLDADGREPIRLTSGDTTAGRCPSDADCSAGTPFAWSADGALLALVTGPNARESATYRAQSIFVRTADDGALTHVATCDGRCTDMSWSPHGRRLAFAASNTITVIDMDTGERTEIELAPCADYCVISPPSPTDLAWSSDGSRIASVSGHGVTVSMADGSGPPMLVERRAGEDTFEELTWSSETTIVFSTRRESSEETEGIWSLDIDTGERVQLVDVGPITPFINGLLVASDGSLIWSEYDGANPCPGCPFEASIWKADADGSDPHILYDAGCCTLSNTSDVFTGPVLSPDGAQLVFTVIYDRDRATESGVYVMKLDGTDVRRISTTGTAPAWQPVPEPSS